MENQTFAQALEAAKAEMAKLLKERAKIEDRLSKLAPFVEYLAALCEPVSQEPVQPSIHDIGLSDAMRLAFKSAVPSIGLTPTEVRDKLREQGFHLERYKSELPPIHNTIARLEKAGELEPVTRADGVRAHRWVSGLKRILQDLEPTGSFGAPSSLANTLARVKPRHGRTGRDYNYRNRRAE